MLRLTISQATDADLAAILDIEHLCFSKPWQQQDFINAFYDGDLLYILKNNDKLVGFIHIRIIMQQAELFRIAIHPNSQNKGFAKRLLQQAIKQLAERGVNELLLEVRPSNKAAIALYKNIGFNEILRRKAYYSNPDNSREDAIVMQRYID